MSIVAVQVSGGNRPSWRFRELQVDDLSLAGFGVEALGIALGAVGEVAFAWLLQNSLKQQASSYTIYGTNCGGRWSSA